MKTIVLRYLLKLFLFSRFQQFKIELQCPQHDAGLMQEVVVRPVAHGLEALKEPRPGDVLFEALARRGRRMLRNNWARPIQL